MKRSKQFEISEADKNLFSEMKQTFHSDSETMFFSKLEWKEQYESAYANELLVYEKENPDGIFVLRKYFDTYFIGHCKSDGTAVEFECETLAKALSLRLDGCIGSPKTVTLLEWLRSFDFSIVRYDRNYDND